MLRHACGYALADKGIDTRRPEQNTTGLNHKDRSVQRDEPGGRSGISIWPLLSKLRPKRLKSITSARAANNLSVDQLVITEGALLTIRPEDFATIEPRFSPSARFAVNAFLNNRQSNTFARLKSHFFCFLLLIGS